MATLSRTKMQVKMGMDDRTAKLFALKQSLKSTGGYISLPDQNSNDDWYLDVLFHRADRILAWAETSNEEETDDDA